VSPVTDERTHPLAPIGRFLTDLYATMVDPIATGSMSVEEMCRVLLAQAVTDREALAELQARRAADVPIAAGPSAGDLVIAAVDRWFAHVSTCTAGQERPGYWLACPIVDCHDGQRCAFGAAGCPLPDAMRREPAECATCDAGFNQVRLAHSVWQASRERRTRAAE